MRGQAATRKLNANKKKADLLLILGLIAALLLPFCAKAIHIDDPLFIWTAEQIRAHPLDPYGAKVNWDGWDTPLHWINMNPPLASYYIALVSLLTGWNEIGLHLAFLLPALALATGAYFLAQRMCQRPVEAAFAGLLTPVVLLSATTLMCDVMMLAFWCWALVFWIDGIQTDKPRFLIFGVLCATCAGLTKYFGICVLPLMIVYALTEKRRPGVWLPWAALPAVIMVFYFGVTKEMYGHNLFTSVASYSIHLRKAFNIEVLAKAATGLAFAGGCVISSVFYAPRCWSKGSWLIGLGLSTLVVGAFLLAGDIGNTPFRKDGNGPLRWTFAALLIVFIAGGAHILMLAVLDAWGQRDSTSVLLVLWIFGTFVFATFLNWTTSGRSMLPLAPAVGILLLRRIERRLPEVTSESRIMRFGTPLQSFAIAMLVVMADYQWAGSIRYAAHQLHARYQRPNRTLWYIGTWGFHWYCKQLGAKRIETVSSHLRPGDVLFVFSMCPDGKFPPRDKMELLEECLIQGPLYCSSLNADMRAGFYANRWGELPFALGRVPPDRYEVYRMREEVIYESPK